MKRLIFTSFLFITFTSLAFAQSETLLKGDVDHGGFGGLISSFSQINNSLGVTFGGYGAWLIDHTFAIGGGGIGLTNNVKFDETQEGDRYISFGYGGFYLGYINKSNKLVHFTLESFIGSGAINLHYNSDGDDLLDDDRVFVVDPTLNAELNLTNYMRIILGVGYRFVTGVTLEGMENEDFSSPTLRASIRFGAF